MTQQTITREVTTSQKKQPSNFDNFNLLSKAMHKKQSEKRDVNNSSCDVSYSVCEDSIVQEESSISSKIKSVNCHNHNTQDNVKGQI